MKHFNIFTTLLLIVAFGLSCIVMTSCGDKSNPTENAYKPKPQPDTKPDPDEDEENPGQGGEDEEEEQDPPTNGETIPLADPFILLHNGTYYAYGTGGFMGFEVATSQTLNVWKRRQGNNDRGMALHKSDTPEANDEKPSLWAPEVYYIEKEKMFYMYYTSDERLYVATCLSPLGPFKTVKTNGEMKSMYSRRAIDNTLFVDDNGDKYMFFDDFSEGMSIWGAKMNSYTTIDEATRKKCLTYKTQSWETDQVIEGSTVFKRGTTYYMLFSSNNYVNPKYGVGYATATDPLGTWKKYSGNPLLLQPKSRSLDGTGHGSLFQDKKGNWKYVFHAHQGVNNLGVRQMHITDVTFHSNGTISISENYKTPTAAK